MPEEIHQTDGQLEHPTIRNEKSDASFGWILGLVIGAMVLAAVINYLVLAFFYGEERLLASRRKSTFPLATEPSRALPPEPRLEPIRSAGENHQLQRLPAGREQAEGPGELRLDIGKGLHPHPDRPGDAAGGRAVAGPQGPGRAERPPVARERTRRSRRVQFRPDVQEEVSGMVRAMILTLLLLSWLGAGPVWGEASLPASLQDVGFDQKRNAQVPLDLPFKDETGRPVRLGDYFGSKPVILNLAYFRCPMLCDQVMNGMVRTMLEMPLEVGKDFNVVTVSFDARETPEMASAKRETYLQRYGRDQAREGWHFLTGAEESIKSLTGSVGFRYRYDAGKDQFAHAAGIVVLTPEGKVSKYFYDIRYSARDLRLGLVDASANKIGSVVDQVLLFCFHYDPIEGKYGPAVMRVVRVGGVLIVLGLGVFVIALVRGDRRRRLVPIALEDRRDKPGGSSDEPAGLSRRSSGEESNEIKAATAE